MGCCLSTSHEQRHPDCVASSPTLPLEEETVKEVLLETPIIPKPANEKQSSKPKPVLESHKYIKPEISPARVTENRNPHLECPTEEKEVTVSEMSSFRKSVLAQANNDGVEVNQKRLARKVREDGGDRRRVAVKRLTEPSTVNRRNVEKEKKSGEEAAPSNVKKSGEEIAHPNMSKTVENGGGNDNAVLRGDPEAESLENPVVSLECFIFL